MKTEIEKWKKKCIELYQKCVNIQEIILEMKARTKHYYENMSRNQTDPITNTPHWYHTSRAEYSTMLRIHKKESLDYARVKDAFKKLETTQKVISNFN